MQITGDPGTGDMYIAGMDEGGGGFPHNDTNKFTGPPMVAIPGPIRTPARRSRDRASLAVRLLRLHVY